jgi:cytochrome c
MSIRTTIAGWVLGSGIVALGLASLSTHYFEADKAGRPEKMGYAIAGVAEAGAGAAKEPPFEAFLAKADAAKGQEAFAKCAACHSIAQGAANTVGPNLWAVLGDDIGKGRGFAFSDTLAAKGGKWDFAKLNEWLKNPAAFAAGTKMAFPGIESAEERANVIAYLNKQGSNLPLPAVPAEAAAPAAAAAPKVAVGDAAKGKEAFAKCAVCHSVAPGAPNGVGPNLAKIYGDAVGKGRGFAFSDTLAAKGGKWDEAALDKWLTNPAAFAAGTKMAFPGLESAQERADVIAYLKTL